LSKNPNFLIALAFGNQRPNMRFKHVTMMMMMMKKIINNGHDDDAQQVSLASSRSRLWIMLT